MPEEQKKNDECCPRFDPAPWQEKEVVWSDKLFVKDHVHSFLHIPLDMGAKITKNVKLIETAGALPAEFLMVTDETSSWGSDIYLAVTKEVPGGQMARISGTFLTKAYEGSYKDIGKWIADMQTFVKSRGKTVSKMYFYYTTCPKCAKKYGKNYTVLLAKVA